MLRVYKYQIPVDDYFTLQLPRGAKPLRVAEQHGVPMMWALADPMQPSEPRRFRFAGTGHPITECIDRLRFISTFDMEGGLVFHIFEVL